MVLLFGYAEITKEQIGNGKQIKKSDLKATYGQSSSDYVPASQEYIYETAEFEWGGVTPPPPNNNYPFTQNPNYDWNRDQLLEESIYDNNGVLRKQTINNYRIRNFEKIKVVGRSFQYVIVFSVILTTKS